LNGVPNILFVFLFEQQKTKNMEHNIQDLVKKMNASMKKHAALAPDERERAVRADCPVLASHYESIFEKNMKGELDTEMFNFMLQQAAAMRSGNVNRDTAYKNVTDFYTTRKKTAEPAEPAPQPSTGLSYSDFLNALQGR
jgi:hypothetical protein